MVRINPSVLFTTPLLAAFVLLLMSVENPFSIALSALMIAGQVPLIRWILGFEGRARPDPVSC